MSALRESVEPVAAPSSPKEPRLVPGRFLLGLGPDILSRPLDMLTELGQLGDVVRFRLPGMRAVLVNHPDLIRRVFQEYKTYDKQMRSYRRFALLLGEGLVTSDGEHWLRQRRIAQPAFHRQRIAGFGEIMVRLTQGAGDDFAARTGRGEPINVVSEMARLTLSILCEAMLGGDVPDDTETLAVAFNEVIKYLVERLNQLFYLPLWVPTPANRRCRAALTSLNEVVYRMIARRRAEKVERLDLLSMLLHARDADTGEIVWYYQHIVDHWDLDHPFERLLVETAVRSASAWSQHAWRALPAIIGSVLPMVGCQFLRFRGARRTDERFEAGRALRNHFLGRERG